MRYTRPFRLVIFQHGLRLIPAPVTGEHPIVTARGSRPCLVCVDRCALIWSLCGSGLACGGRASKAEPAADARPAAPQAPLEHGVVRIRQQLLRAGADFSLVR